MSPKSVYERDGFVLFKGVFPESELVDLESEFDRIVTQVLQANEDVNARWAGPEVDQLGAANTVVLHTHNVHHYSARWMQALLSPTFLNPVREILGDDVVLHHTKLFQKPAEIGSPFPMHQDWGFFPTFKDSMLAAVIHLSDATDEMGCIRVFPGSHHRGRLDGSMGSTDKLMAEFPIEKAVPLEAQRGDLLIFSYLLVHGSMPNRSNQVRKTVLVQMHAGDDALQPPVAHPYEGVALSGWNHGATRSSSNRMK